MANDDLNKPSRLVVVDDQRSFAEALKLTLGLTDDLRVVGIEVDAQTGFDLYETVRPDLVVTSYRCLLYTSPSPRDATLSRMPSSA